MTPWFLLLLPSICAAITKSVTLTKSNPSINGATATVLIESADVIDINQWGIQSDISKKPKGFHMHLAMNSSWGFHPNMTSIITLIINSTDSNIEDNANIIISFSVANNTYFNMVINHEMNNQIYPKCYNSTLANGDIRDSMTDFEESETRYSVSAGDDESNYDDIYPSNIDNEWPLIFTIQNVPGKHVLFSYTNPSIDDIQTCEYMNSFPVNQGMDIYLTQGHQTESLFKINAFTIQYMDSINTDSPTSPPPSILQVNGQKPTIAPISGTDITGQQQSTIDTNNGEDAVESIESKQDDLESVFLIIGIGLVVLCAVIFGLVYLTKNRSKEGQIDNGITSDTEQEEGVISDRHKHKKTASNASNQRQRIETINTSSNMMRLSIGYSNVNGVSPISFNSALVNGDDPYLPGSVNMSLSHLIQSNSQLSLHGHNRNESGINVNIHGHNRNDSALSQNMMIMHQHKASWNPSVFNYISDNPQSDALDEAGNESEHSHTRSLSANNGLNGYNDIIQKDIEAAVMDFNEVATPGGDIDDIDVVTAGNDDNDNDNNDGNNDDNDAQEKKSDDDEKEKVKNLELLKDAAMIANVMDEEDYGTPNDEESETPNGYDDDEREMAAMMITRRDTEEEELRKITEFVGVDEAHNDQIIVGDDDDEYEETPEAIEHEMDDIDHDKTTWKGSSDRDPDKNKKKKGSVKDRVNGFNEMNKNKKKNDGGKYKKKGGGGIGRDPNKNKKINIDDDEKRMDDKNKKKNGGGKRVSRVQKLAMQFDKK